jgi:hypothetical protein
MNAKRIRVASGLVAVALAIGGSAYAVGRTSGHTDTRGHPGTSAAAALTAAKSSALAKGSSPTGSNAIKVHGWWTINVRNPDGKLVSHHEFENSYVGGSVLSQILARNLVVGKWRVELANIDQDFRMSIREPNLIPTAPTSGANANKLVLTGSLVIGDGGQPVPLTGSIPITSVATYVETCTSSFTPDGCTTATSPSPISMPVTFKDLTGGQTTQGILVHAGQTVDVTVAISFS